MPMVPDDQIPAPNAVLRPEFRIRAAIEATREVVPGYFEGTLAQRAGASKEAVGSTVWDVDAEQLEQLLVDAQWEPYSHPAVAEGCEAFKTSIHGGFLGVIRLDELSPDFPVTLDDRKDTGKVSAIVKGQQGETVDFLVLILGQEQGREVVFTFHPGDPVKPSQVEASQGLHGKEVTVAEALALGLETAKIA